MPSVEHQAELLLSDALDQTVSNPSASHRWHTLLNLYASAADDAQRAAVQQHVLARITQGGEVGFFRDTFMAAVTNDIRYTALAGQALKTIKPFDADRLMAFSVYEWGRQAQGAGGGTQLIDALCAACVPDLMTLTGNALLPFAPPVRQAPHRVGRIALITPYISTANHPPTVLAFQQARLLSESGLQVRIFSSQELRVQHMADYLGSNGQLHMAPPHLDTLRPLIPDGVSLTISDERFSLMRRYRDLLAAVTAFDPDVVFFVGLMSPLMTPLHVSRPALGLCVHAVQPMVPVDVWLTAKPSQADRLNAAWGDALAPAWGCHHPYRVQLKPTAGVVTRNQLALPQEGVVLITVGSRLKTEIVGAWASAMVGFLGQHPAVKWLLVGGDGDLPAALADVAAGQVMTLPHQHDLRGLMRCTDICVNPERLGGGFSIAEAMAEGLAVVALADSDGGDKLGPAAATDREDFFAKLHVLVSDPTARQQLGSALQTRFAQELDLCQSGPSLLSACELTLARFHERPQQATPDPIQEFVLAP
jgi:glycosyltransferase involved in cell wall biosynthesis